MQFAGSLIGDAPLQPLAAYTVQQGSEAPAPCLLHAPSSSADSRLPQKPQAPAQQPASQQSIQMIAASTFAEPVRRTLHRARSSEKRGCPPVQASADAAISNGLSQHLQAAAHISSVPVKSRLLAPSSSVPELGQHTQSHSKRFGLGQTHPQQASREILESPCHALPAQPSRNSVPSAQTLAAKRLEGILVPDVSPAAAKQPVTASRNAAEDRSAEESAEPAKAKHIPASRVTRFSRQAPSESADVGRATDEKAVQDGSSSSGGDDAYSFQGSSDDEDDAVSDSAAARGKAAGRQTVPQLRTR